MPGPIDQRFSRPPMPRRPSRRRRFLSRLGAFALVLGLIGAVAVGTDTLGVGDGWERLVGPAASPGPDAAGAPSSGQSAAVTPLPPAAPTFPLMEPSPTPTPQPAPTPSPTPARVPVDVALGMDPDSVFAHELTKTWCAPAGIQIVLAMHGMGDTSDAFQREIAGRVHEFESYDDSHNGGWGPMAIVRALASYGVPGYEVRVDATRDDALRAAASAIGATGAPAVLLAWRGAHTWVMSGYRADADPGFFPDATVSGAYIVDPWYPSVSSIWGPSDPPGTFQDDAEMVRNFLPWKRPEGRYPERDGRFITVIPTLPLIPG
jgi:hypothetical protein